MKYTPRIYVEGFKVELLRKLKDKHDCMYVSLDPKKDYIEFIPKSSHDELLEAVREYLDILEDSHDSDSEDEHDLEKGNRIIQLQKTIAKASLTAGDPTEYVAGTTKGDERD